MGACNDTKARVYDSIEEIMADPELTDEERLEIMTKSKTSVQIDATKKKTTWIRTNRSNDNRVRTTPRSSNTGAYGTNGR